MSTTQVPAVSIKSVDTFTTVAIEPVTYTDIDGRQYAIVAVIIDREPNPADRVRARFRGYSLKKDGTQRSGTSSICPPIDFADALEAAVRAEFDEVG